jgi:hypothetical protein
MSLRPTALGVLVLASLVACGGPDRPADTRQDRSELDALERRLTDLDRRLSAIEKTPSGADGARADIRALEQRVANSEAKAAQALETAKRAAASSRSPVVVPGAPAQPVRADQVDPEKRREQLNDLSNEYFRKRADLATATQNQSRLEQTAARRELRQWYMSRRRAILRGEPPPE